MSIENGVISTHPFTGETVPGLLISRFTIHLTNRSFVEKVGAKDFPFDAVLYRGGLGKRPGNNSAFC